MHGKLRGGREIHGGFVNSFLLTPLLSESGSVVIWTESMCGMGILLLQGDT